MIEDTLTDLRRDRIQYLADPMNQTIVSILEEADGPLPVEELARRLVDRDVEVVEAVEFAERRDRTAIKLHHDHLPKLDEIDLVNYDHGSNTVEVAPSLHDEVEWMTEITEAIKAQVDGSDVEAEGIGIIEGTETIARYGRKLSDEADEELFCMHVSPDLITDECIAQLQDATARGVRVFLGSEDRVLRNRIRKNVPEATIWEPQLDWMNAPTYPRVGRLVFADRERVMLAVIEDGDDGGPVETALVGNGEENPLVVLVRELLGQRLDHLDFQHEHVTGGSTTRL